jgi:tetratricopeptide (TPR) repeat protein
MFLRDLRDDPGNIDTLLEYGEALVDLGRLPEAAEKFRRVLELEPANVDAHFRLGEIALEARRFEQAHLEFELVLKLDPQFPQVRAALAEALLRRGRVERARPFLREELDLLQTAEQAGDDRIDRGRFGGLLLDAGLAAEAAGVFEQAMAAGGESPEPLRKLALARFRAGDRKAGVAASRRVLKLDPKCVASMHNLALAALQRGRIRPAAGWIDRGLKVDRHDDELRRLRMRMYLAWVGRAVRRLF